jgi:argonaute-like protein implicated in RNA metabolism and viral defense
VVAVVPDKGWAAGQEGIDDPFDDFKKQFGQDKVPSQMVTESSLTEYAFLGNIATGVVAKAGGIPWRVHKIPGGADVFIGLDVTYDPETRQHVGASANIVMADGTILASESVSLQQGETFDVDDVIGILKNLIRVYVKEEGHAPNHVIIHRDGRFFLDIDELVARLNEASDFIPKFDLVEITKGGNPRIGEYNGSSFEVADKGVGFVSKYEEQAFLATTGKPELKPGNRLGTPRPIRITKRHGPTDVETLTKQVYWLSEAHVASISRSTRLPITTHYADLCADHARKGYMIHDELVRGVPYV